MNRRATRVLAIALALSIAPLAAAAQEQTTASEEQATQSGVLVASTFMYFFRDAGSSPVAFLPAGARVRVLKRDGEWYEVIFRDPRFGDATGYVPASSIRIETGSGELDAARSGGGLTIAQRGFVEGKGFGFPRTANNDSTRAIGDALFREEVFVKPSAWLQFSAGVDLRANSHDEVDEAWRVDFSDRGLRRPAIAVRRLAATFRSGGFAIDAGKQFIRWARADILNPEDRFAPRDYLSVLDADLLPVLAVRPSYQIGKETFEVVWAPRMTPSRLPLLDHRWAVLPSDASGFAIADLGSSIPEGSEWGARWGHTGDGAEFSLSYFDGFNHLPTFSAQVLPALNAVGITRVYPALRSYGADAAVATRWATIKGEASYFTSPSNDTDEYILWVAELERQTGEWLLDVGYIGEVTTVTREAFPFAPDRGIAKSIIGRAAYTVDPRRSIAIEGALRQGGEGVYVKGEYSQTWGQHWRLTLAGIGIGGQDDDFIGQYNRNSYGSVALRFSF